MFGSKRNKETERFYLLPGQGGQAYRRKQKFILNGQSSWACCMAAASGGVDVLFEQPITLMARLTRRWRLLVFKRIR